MQSVLVMQLSIGSIGIVVKEVTNLKNDLNISFGGCADKIQDPELLIIIQYA